MNLQVVLKKFDSPKEIIEVVQSPFIDLLHKSGVINFFSEQNSTFIKIPYVSWLYPNDPFELKKEFLKLCLDAGIISENDFQASKTNNPDIKKIEELVGDFRGIDYDSVDVMHPDIFDITGAITDNVKGDINYQTRKIINHRQIMGWFYDNLVSLRGLGLNIDGKALEQFVHATFGFIKGFSAKKKWVKDKQIDVLLVWDSQTPLEHFLTDKKTFFIECKDMKNKVGFPVLYKLIGQCYVNPIVKSINDAFPVGVIVGKDFVEGLVETIEKMNANPYLQTKVYLISEKKIAEYKDGKLEFEDLFINKVPVKLEEMNA